MSTRTGLRAMPLAPRMAYWCKFAVAHVLYGLGALQLWQAIVLRGRAVVLMYHRVLTPEEQRVAGSHPAMVVTRETFEMQMALLERRFVPLSVEAFWDRLSRRTPFENSSCLITFDDGWRDNVVNALPSLRAHGLPALVFLPVNFIGTARVFWQEALAHLLPEAVEAAGATEARRTVLGTLLAPHGLGHLLDADADTSAEAIFGAIDALKPTPRAQITALVESLSHELGVSADALAERDGFMSWDQVAQMARTGVAFGGHGAEHHLLTYVPPDVVSTEVRGSMERLRTAFGQPPLAFSYPNGYLNEGIVEEVRRAGYRLGFITRRGRITCEDDPLTIRRVNIHDWMTDTAPMFLARLVGLW